VIFPPLDHSLRPPKKTQGLDDFLVKHPSAKMHFWMFPKNGGVFSPKSSILIRVFHDFHHPFWGFSPYFWETPPFFFGKRKQVHGIRQDATKLSLGGYVTMAWQGTLAYFDL